VGVKMTLIVQEVLPARSPPQVFVWEKSPLTVSLAMLSLALPVLLSVIGCDRLEVPATWVPKVTVAGVSLTVTIAGHGRATAAAAKSKLRQISLTRTLLSSRLVSVKW